MKFNLKEYLGYFLSMFLIVTLSNLFVDVFGDGDPYRLFKLEPYLYIIFFAVIVVGSLLVYYVSKTSIQKNNS